MSKSKDKVKKPWDENLPENEKYIKKFFKKSEKEIKEMQNEGDTK